LVTGEAGIGKSRLIRESLLGLGIEGQEVFWADQAELEQQIPLNPLIEALRKPRVSDTLALLDDPWRAVLYGVMPGHFRGEGKIPQAPEIGPKSVPRRLFEAFDQIFLKLIQAGPVTLVLEDLQWADQTTLSVLEFLFRRWEQGNLQAVFSLRSEEIQRNSALRSFLETLRVHEDFLEIPLEDLSPLDSKTLIRDLSDHPLSEDEVAHLHSLAGGNPFFLIEMTLEYLTGRVNRPSVTDRALSIPISIRQVLERRLTQLSPAAETVLGVLAVHSRALPIEHLARVADLPTWQCMNGLDQLEGFRLVQSDGTEISALHELIRKTAYQSLTSSRRAWLHRRLGIHIQEFTEDPPPDELAIHFDHAGDGELALKFAREAAQKAEASGAIAEALKFLDIARDHSQAPEEVATLIQRMGRLNFLTQDHQKAAPLLEVAAQRLRLQGMTAEALSAEVDRVDSLGQSGLLPLRERMEELERIKKEARDNGHWEIFMKALDVAIHVADHTGDSEGVQAVLREARSHSDTGPPEANCRARAVLALDVYFGNPSDGLRAAREAVQIAFATGKVELELRALNRLIVVLLYQGLLHTTEGRTAFQEAERRFSRCGDLINKFFIRLNRAVGHLEVGELAEASAAFPAAEAVIRGTEPGDLLTRFLINRGELELEQNENQAARKSFSEALSLISDSSPSFFRTISTAGVGLCALREGDLTTAKRLESDMPALPRHWTFDPSVVAAFKVALLRMRGDFIAADRFLEDVADGIKDRFVTTWVKLNIGRVRILRKVSPTSAKNVAAETLEKAVDLGLKVRILQLERLMDRI
jgi:tetratricopeptide (TPR) repeat protein